MLRLHGPDESVDLVYLDPPFHSNANYNVLFAERDGTQAAAQIKVFEDTWRWDEGAARAYADVVEAGGRVSQAMQAFRTFLGESDMLAYLAMMAPRLVELRRVLKQAGTEGSKKSGDAAGNVRERLSLPAAGPQRLHSGSRMARGVRPLAGYPHRNAIGGEEPSRRRARASRGPQGRQGPCGEAVCKEAIRHRETRGSGTLGAHPSRRLEPERRTDLCVNDPIRLTKRLVDAGRFAVLAILPCPSQRYRTVSPISPVRLTSCNDEPELRIMIFRIVSPTSGRKLNASILVNPISFWFWFSNVTRMLSPA